MYITDLYVTKLRKFQVKLKSMWMSLYIHWGTGLKQFKMLSTTSLSINPSKEQFAGPCSLTISGAGSKRRCNDTTVRLCCSFLLRKSKSMNIPRVQRRVHQISPYLKSSTDILHSMSVKVLVCCALFRWYGKLACDAMQAGLNANDPAYGCSTG